LTWKGHRVFTDNYHPNADTWTTARTLTIGNTGKSVNGSGNVSWTLAEIGAPSTTGSGASGTWGINITGDAQYLAKNVSSPSNANDIFRAGVYTFFNGTNVPPGDFGLISIPTWNGTSSSSRYNLQIGANIGGSLRYRATDINGAGSFRIVWDQSNLTNLNQLTNGPGYVTANNYLTGVSGSGNGTVSFTRTGLSTLTWNAAHTHDDRYYTESESNSLYVPIRSRTTWNNATSVIDKVIGQLAWKNYGNNHTIFDASAGTSPDGTAVNNTNPGVNWTGSYPTLMGWNGSNTYGVRVDSARISDNTSGNANTVDGYHIVYGSTGSDTSTLYFVP
jgi:hypothetical protein